MLILLRNNIFSLLFSCFFFFLKVGLDIAPTAVQSAENYFHSLNNVEMFDVTFQHGSFFDDVKENSYDVGYDYTFFCALSPDLRQEWANTYANILKPNGILITIIFPILPGKINGPPYAVSFDMYKEILVPVGFILVDGPTVVENEMAHESRGNGKTMIASWKKI